MPAHVEGYTGLMRALQRADRETRLGVRRELRQAAEPVQRDAEVFARQRIPRIGEPWSRMRVGVTTKVVYVAPRQRSRSLNKRPNLAGLLMERAMQPALDAHEHETVRELDRMLDRVADRFNHG